jgi:hypothetical protein
LAALGLFFRANSFQRIFDSMDFRTALDLLSPCVSEAAIAAAAGVSAASVQQARLPEGSADHHAPPDDWERILARLARERARDLLAVADELDPRDRDPDWESAYG